MSNNVAFAIGSVPDTMNKHTAANSDQPVKNPNPLPNILDTQV